jgi:hypothetical protein
MENSLKNNTRMIMELYESYFLQNKIFLCHNNDEYAKIVLFIRHIQDPPEKGMKESVVALRKEKENRELTEDENACIYYYYSIWEQTISLFNDLKGRAFDSGFISGSASLIQEVETLRGVYQLLVDYVVLKLFNGYTEIAVFTDGK